MRMALALSLVLVVSACVASTEGGPSEPSVSVGAVTTAVTTTALVTTTTPVATTVEGRDCPESGRGYQCPPDMWLVPAGSPSAFSGGLHASGRYRTRVFMPSIEFTQLDQFTGYEHELALVVDVVGCVVAGPCHKVLIFGPALAAQVDLETLASRVCIEEIATIGDVAFGLPATVLELRMGCAEILVAEAVGRPAGVLDGGNTVRLMAVNLDDDTQIFVIVEAPTPEFDAYLEEVAQPILDSIRFLDG